MSQGKVGGTDGRNELLDKPATNVTTRANEGLRTGLRLQLVMPGDEGREQYLTTRRHMHAVLSDVQRRRLLS